MATTITFDYNNMPYTLEFTRRTVEIMEDKGFKIAEIGNRPSTLRVLFAGAFLAHHRNTDSKVIEEIYNCLPDKEELFKTLMIMYNEPLEALLAEPEDGKKVMWKVK